MNNTEFWRTITLGQALDWVSGMTRPNDAEPKPEPENLSGEKAGRPVSEIPRRFVLKRVKDHSGVSGTGYVASGVQFRDGQVVVRWYGDSPSTSIWKDIKSFQAVHGHEGSTLTVWLD